MRQLIPGVTIAASVMQLGGCAVVPWGKEPGVCFVVTGIKGDATPYVMYERGRENRVYSATGEWWAYWWFLPFVPVEGGMMDDHLFTRPVPWWDCLAPYEMSWGPRERSLGTIEELAEWLSPAPFWIGEQRQTDASQRWILSNEPMVIAIGTDQVKLDPIKHDYHSTWSLVRRADIDRTATELVVLDQWPPDWSKESPKGTEQDNRYEALLAKVARHVQFEHPLTLREIFQRRLWEPGAWAEDGTTTR
jgi:hypothetical protein